MSTVMIVLILVAVALVVLSLVLGRSSYEVESARDTEYIELEGHWVRYRVTGGGPPVLLVHGWLSSSRVWEPLVDHLARRFTVYALDLTGFGESDKPTEGYGVRYGSRLLYAFCVHFGLARTTVIGHDIGGVMAVKLAADHPDLIGRLVLVATPADEEQMDLPTLLWLTTLPVAGPVFYALGRLLRPVRRLWTRPFVLDAADLPESFVEDADRSTPAAVARSFNAVRREISGGRLARQARIIKVPVLLVAGEEDQVVDPRAVGDWGQNVTQAEIALLGECGHLPMVEVPPEFGARVMAFLTGDAGYLERIREVPQPAGEEPPGEEPDARAGGLEILETPAPQDRPDREVSFFDDLVWDFAPETPATPRESAGDPNIHRCPTAEDGRPRRMPDTDADNGKASEVEDDHSGAWRPPDKRIAGREPDGGRIPEFPGDLFRWSEPPREFNPGRPSPRRAGRGEKEPPGDGDPEKRD